MKFFLQRVFLLEVDVGSCNPFLVVSTCGIEVQIELIRFVIFFVKEHDCFGSEIIDPSLMSSLFEGHLVLIKESKQMKLLLLIDLIVLVRSFLLSDSGHG